jgi:hypothetical protein
MSLFVLEAWHTKCCFRYGDEKTTASPENWTLRPIFFSPTVNYCNYKYPTSCTNNNDGEDGDDADYDDGGNSDELS